MKVNSFQNPSLLEADLAQKIAESLISAIELQDEASILVSGGSSPVKLFQALSKINLPWDKIQIGLIDERFVEADSEFSNELLVKTHLLQNKAKNAHFTGMVYDSMREVENLVEANKKYQELLTIPVTVSILGMGDDGHTASLFPSDENSEKELKKGKKLELISTKAPNYPQKRITCSKHLILSSESVYVLIFGKSKLEILKKSEFTNLPIAHFVEEKNVEIYYSEEK